MGINALYASLFEDPVTRLDLHDLPTSHSDGPAYPNVLRHTDIPEVTAIAAGRSRCVIYTDRPDEWTFATQVKEKLGWEKQFEIRETEPPTK